MALDVEKQVRFWQDGAEEAFATAQLLISNRRYNFGLFLLHLALEKMLKALVARQTQDVPPKTHNLVLLSQRAGLSPTADVSGVLGEFQAYCLAGRYPDDESAMLDRSLAQRELARAKETYAWLQQQLSK
jgi:HEPN domain-containing protein